MHASVCVGNRFLNARTLLRFRQRVLPARMLLSPGYFRPESNPPRDVGSRLNFNLTFLESNLVAAPSVARHVRRSAIARESREPSKIPIDPTGVCFRFTMKRDADAVLVGTNRHSYRSSSVIVCG